jgi:hypothetical protein
MDAGRLTDDASHPRAVSARVIAGRNRVHAAGRVWTFLR